MAPIEIGAANLKSLRPYIPHSQISLVPKFEGERDPFEHLGLLFHLGQLRQFNFQVVPFDHGHRIATRHMYLLFDQFMDLLRRTYWSDHTL